MEDKENCDKIYEKIVNEQSDNMKNARIEAEKEEKQNNDIFLAIFITLTIVFILIGVYKMHSWFISILCTVVPSYFVSAIIWNIVLKKRRRYKPKKK